MQDIFAVDGLIVLITGGLGRIGSAFVREFHHRGARVVVASRGADDARLAALVAGADADDRVMAVTMDVTSKSSVHEALGAIEKRWGVPDVLVNNAAIDMPQGAPPEASGPFENFPVETFREVLDVNLVGTFLVTQAVGGRMRAVGKQGSIINVGSVYGMLSPVQDIYAYLEEKTGVAVFKPIAYSVAKSGIYNLTRYCATYWGRYGIRVNTLTPSGVWRDGRDARFQENYTSRMPLGRFAEADEFNGAVIFMASDASRYMTGSNVVVDGGWTAW